MLFVKVAIKKSLNTLVNLCQKLGRSLMIIQYHELKNYIVKLKKIGWSSDKLQMTKYLTTMEIISG